MIIEPEIFEINAQTFIQLSYYFQQAYMPIKNKEFISYRNCLHIINTSLSNYLLYLKPLFLSVASAL